MDLNELFWNAGIEDLKRGYVLDVEGGEYICLVCGERYENGVVYSLGGRLLEAEKAVKEHIAESHGSMFHYLIDFNSKYTKLTENQKEILKLYYGGLSDKEIVKKTTATSASTIRNSRFAQKERYKQAKITVAITELLEEHRKTLKTAPVKDELINIHRSVTTVDERFAITQSERDAVLERYFDDSGTLKIKNLPKKENRRIVIFQVIMENFSPGETYTEKDVNNVIAAYYQDIETIRRFLIDYGFMARTKDGRKYWVK